jgi:hypothetical protein
MHWYGTCVVRADTAVADPALFEAVTATRSVEPVSASRTTYVGSVASGMLMQFVVVPLHLCHWYVYESGGVPRQLPGVAESR